MNEVFTSGSDGVELIVNGESRGTVSVNGQTVGQFVRAQASRYGLKSFTVYVNGTKFFTEQANDRLADGSRVELVAKDARGCPMTMGGTEGPVQTDTPAEPQKQADGDPGDEHQPAPAA